MGTNFPCHISDGRVKIFYCRIIQYEPLDAGPDKGQDLLLCFPRVGFVRASTLGAGPQGRTLQLSHTEFSLVPLR